MKWFCCIVIGLLGLGLNGQDDDVISLNRGDIDRLNVTSIQELLNRLPGIAATESSVKIRGSSAVKVLVDGKPINNPLSSHSSIKWGLVSFASVESVEIYRGAGAAMFGEGTDGGAIVITRKKGGLSTGSVLVEAGNYGAWGFEFSGQFPLGRHNLQGSYEDSRSNGYRENGDTHKYSFGFLDQLSFDNAQSMSASGSYSWEERGSPGYPDYPRLNAREFSEAFSTSLYYEKGESLKSTLYYRSFWNKSEDPDRSLLSVIQNHSIGNRTDFRLPIATNHFLPVGFSFESSRYEGTQLSDQDEQEAAVFSSWMTRLLSESPVFLSLTGRFNWYSEFEEVLDPSARLIYNPDNWKFFVSAGKGHLAPSILKRYQSSSSRIPNPDLGMEQTSKLEAGIGYTVSDVFSFQTMVYSKDTSDRITYVRLEEGLAQYRNIGEASWLGVETTLSGLCSQSLRYSITHSWMDARDESNALVLTASPKHRFQGELEWNPCAGFKLFLSGNYYSRQFSRSDNTESVPSYFLIDARFEYQRGNNRCFVKIENLLDHDFLYGDGLPGAPAEFLVGFKRSF